MPLEEYNWYAKNIAPVAAYGRNETAAVDTAGLNFGETNSRFLTHSSVVGGRVVVVDSSIAPIFLAAVTLAASTALPLIFARCSKLLAVIGDAMRLLRSRQYAGNGLQTETTATHLPVMLANGGLWTSDAWTAVTLSIRHIRKKQLKMSSGYIAFCLFALMALAIGPLTAFLISREVVIGFGGRLRGPCIRPFNFTIGAANIVSAGTDHHGRAIELLPWLSTFNYPWSSSNGGDEYLSGKSIIDPISGANYTQLAGCELGDDVLCDKRFPYTHMVSGELTGPQLGLWSRNNWKLAMESFCVRLNSTAISYYDPIHGWNYHLSFAPGSTSPRNATFLENALGQRETERYARKKNFITDTYFIDDPSIGWGLERWRPSLRNLEVDELAVITILPPTEAINQDVSDYIYSAPVTAAAFDFRPSQMVHLLCWEKLFISVGGVTTSTLNRTNFVQGSHIPLGVEPLMQMARGEFIIKPLRFLRGNTLLQYFSDTPRWEYNATLAPIIPFGAEMHRWGHIGLMDIASKATRTVTGYYARGVPQNSSSIDSVQNPYLLDLCDSIRTAKQGTVSLSIWIVLLLLVILVLALFWWLAEVLLTTLAQKGYPGPLRAFLILPATRPTALSTSVALALNGSDIQKVKHSASGYPEITGEFGDEIGASLLEVSNGWVLSWSQVQKDPSKKVKIV